MYFDNLIFIKFVNFVNIKNAWIRYINFPKIFSSVVLKLAQE